MWTVCRTTSIRGEAQRRQPHSRKWRHDHVQRARCVIVMATSGHGGAAWSRDVGGREAAVARRETQWRRSVRVYGDIVWSLADRWRNDQSRRHRCALPAQLKHLSHLSQDPGTGVSRCGLCAGPSLKSSDNLLTEKLLISYVVSLILYLLFSAVWQTVLLSQKFLCCLLNYFSKVLRAVLSMNVCGIYDETEIMDAKRCCLLLSVL